MATLHCHASFPRRVYLRFYPREINQMRSIMPIAKVDDLIGATALQMDRSPPSDVAQAFARRARARILENNGYRRD